ncbi:MULTISPECIES: TetR/AcrR family transcriptional regulator [Actinomadura]|uniref:TetR/AcrR family transcriptional regulator n=2 Tax=Actinomadura yumaensis TaxID=111807 RepID=A0ABW2CIW9_9ACTN|nr:TetR/AcrR family transcriptional regulator [Actinomadura sp. J1-007]MWK40059.1 TetR family transcriptional regulator [Actinomadura sp. J1-007]
MADAEPGGAEPGGLEPGVRRRPPFRRLSQDRRRQDIIAAAIESFGRRPEPEVSIDDIAALAGTSRSSLYRYFDSKQDLYAAAAERVSSELIGRLNEVTAGSPSMQMAVRIGLYFDFLEHYESGFASLLGMGGAQAPEGALAAAQQVREEICAMTFRTLRIEEPGEVLRATVRAWIAGVEWSGGEWLRTRRPERPFVEHLAAAQFATMLLGAAVMDPAAAGRVAWLMEVEPADAPFGALVRGLAGTFDMRTFGHLAKFLGRAGRS